MTARSGALAGAIAGLAAGLAFAGAHAFIITPVWNRMIGGLVFGVIAGAAAGWGYAELQSRDSHSGVRWGLTYGVLLWLSVVPVTLVNAALRATGYAQAHVAVADTISVVLALIGGATLGWIRTRRLRAAIACATAAIVVTMATGGPIPVGRSVRAAEVLFAVLFAALIGGVVVSLIAPRLERQRA